MAAVAVDPFPAHMLEGCETALVVFAAAFGGEQDARHIRDAGLWAACVDEDADALERMSAGYPFGWQWHPWDAFEVLDNLLRARAVFDVVTLDPFTGELMDRTLEALPDFCRLAKSLVVCGVDSRELRAPSGWRVRTKVWRSDLKGGVYWAVLVPA